MHTYFAYLRVSTERQGIHGTSLDEQRSAISSFAGHKDLTITRWFEERESAASSGRLVFHEMMRCLSSGDAQGLIVHKIDRSARNLKDWALLGELIDQGVDVRFAHEDLSLGTRGGRLAADIQAVIAADYVRNLREEVRKGFFGRLKQGLYPMPAPLGYLDRGPGRPKIPHPMVGPMIAHAFRLYATGEHSIRTVRDALTTAGVVNRCGRRLSIPSVHRVLRNPFYTGTIELASGKTFPGRHQPIVSVGLFEQVQLELKRRRYGRKYLGRHRFTYQRLIRCACGWFLVGERQKGHVYYRCHHGCPRVCVREERVEAAVSEMLHIESFAIPTVGMGSTDRHERLRSVASAVAYNNGTFSLVHRAEFESCRGFDPTLETTPERATE